MRNRFKLMTLNIGNPSLQRVKRQIEWIEQREEDVFVLTETKTSEGCNFLFDHFSKRELSFFDFGKEPKFNIYFPKSSTGDLGVMILSRYPILETRTCFESDNKYYSRFADVTIDFLGTKVGIMGLYVPSRDASEEKKNRKKQFIVDFLHNLKKISGQSTYPYIICGDLNVLERNHMPHYSTFQKWEYDFYDRFEHFNFVDAFRWLHHEEKEYSWVGRTNDGYRYDHCFVSKGVANDLVSCYYIHETRKIPITDHSAMVIELDL